MELLAKTSPIPGEEKISETETHKIALILLLTWVCDSNLLFGNLLSIVVLATDGTSLGRLPQTHK